MPTINKSSIGTSAANNSTDRPGYDGYYSTMATWFANRPTSDFVTADIVYKGELWNDSEFMGLSSGHLLLVSGVTTDSTRYPWLTTAPGQSFNDHADKATNPLRYDITKGVGVRHTGGDQQATNVTIKSGSSGQNFRMENIQFYWDYANSSNYDAMWALYNAKVFNLLCQSRKTGAATFSTEAATTITNCVFINTGGGSGLNNGHNGRYYNCTFIRSSNLAEGSHGINNFYGYNIIIKNCAFLGPWLDNTTKTDNLATASCTHNATTRSTIFGSNGVVNLVFTDQIENTTTASMDARVKSTSGLKNAGTRDQTNTSDLDILKRSRSTTTPTIGAMEVVANPDASTLTDNFNDQSMDTAKWQRAHYEGHNAADSSAAETTDGLVRFTTVAPANQNQGNGYLSVNKYNLVNSSVYVKLVSRDTVTNNEAEFAIASDASNFERFAVLFDGPIVAYRHYTGAAGQETIASATYSASTHTWLRIRVDSTTVYWDTAPSTASNPPVSSDWVLFGSAARNSNIDYTAAKLFIGANIGNGDATGYTSVSDWDGFNTASGSAAKAPLTATVTTYTSSTPSATLKLDRKIAATVTSYSVTTTNSGLSKNIPFGATSTAYTLGAPSATLKLDRKLTATAVSYSVAVPSAGLSKGRLLTATTTAYTVGGPSATLSLNKKLVATATSYSVTTLNAGLSKNIPLVTTSTSVTVSTVNADLRQAKKLPTTTAAYTVTTPSATLSKTGRVLSATVTSFAVTSVSTTLKLDKKIPVSPIAFVVTTNSANLPRSKTFFATATSYSLTTGTIQLRRNRTLKAEWVEIWTGGGDVLLTTTVAKPPATPGSDDESYRYTPTEPPLDASLDQVLDWALQELLKAGNVINNLSEGHVAISHKPPARPRDGMVRMADGTDWNPGGGRGYYGYDEATKTWIKL